MSLHLCAETSVSNLVFYKYSIKILCTNYFFHLLLSLHFCYYCKKFSGIMPMHVEEIIQMFTLCMISWVTECVLVLQLIIQLGTASKKLPISRLNSWKCKNWIFSGLNHCVFAKRFIVFKMTAQIKLSQQKKQKLKKVQGGREISVNMSKIPQYG